MKDTLDYLNFAHEGWHTVTPKIVVQGVEQLIDFLRRVFGATGDYRSDRPSVIKIGDSMVMISDVGIRNRDTPGASFHLVVLIV